MEKLLGEKRRYKLYKAKSKWVVATITTTAGLAFMVTTTVNVQADTADNSQQNQVALVKETGTTAESTTTKQVDSNEVSATTGEDNQQNVAQTLPQATAASNAAQTSGVTNVVSATSANATTEQSATTQDVQTATKTAETPQTDKQPTTYQDHVKGNVQEAWDNGYQGQGMVVAVIDSGADTDHKDFAQTPTTPAISKEAANQKIAELGYGKYASAKFPFVYNYASHDNEWIKDDGPNASEHGQHVAGIIAADGQPVGDEEYAVGVAPKAQLMMMRVFNDQFADENTDDIAQAIYDAVKLGANVIQMSLGQGVAAANLNDVEQKAVEYATQNGVFVSISASNNGNSASVDGEDVNYNPGGAQGKFEPFSSSTIANPGAARNALTVAAENSALGTKDAMASFSSWGPLQDFTLKPDVSAPGVSITSTGNDNRYKTMSGTSMAGPFNAGVAALVMQRLKAHTQLNGSQLVQATKALIMNTATPMIQQGYDTPVSPRRQGAGKINAGAAVSSPVYITAADGTSSVSLKKVGETTEFTLTFKNLSDVDQTYLFDDFGGGLTEQLDQETDSFHDVYLAGAHIYGNKKVTVKAGQSATYKYNLTLTGLQPNQLVEGWLRFTSTNDQAQLVVPYLAYYGDLTNEKVFDKAANQTDTVYGGNYFVNEANYPRGVADEESLKALVNLEGNYNWQQVAKLYQDAKVAFSPNSDGKSDLLKPYAFVKQNLKDLKVEVVTKDGQVLRVIADEQGVDKSYYESGINKDLTLSVSMRNDPNTLNWDGKIYDTKTGQMVNAPDGEYFYRYVATLYNSGANQVQTADYPVIIDTKAPVLTDLKYDDKTHILSFNYQDDGAGFTDYSYALVKVNDKTFGYKLNDGQNAKFTNKDRLAGHFSAVLDADTLAAFTAAKNLITVAISDVADNTATHSVVAAGVQARPTIAVWNATNGLALDKQSADYNGQQETYILRGSATKDFYYNGGLVQVAADGTYAVPVAVAAKTVLLTADAAGKEVLVNLKTATPKAVFAWQVNNTVEESFGPILNTVLSNDKNDTIVQAVVTKGTNVKAYAKDYFTDAVYEGEVQDGLATFHVKVTNQSGRTVLVGWTEVAGPTFNVVQKTSTSGVYLGVDTNATTSQTAIFTSAEQLGTTVVQADVDTKTLGNPGDLPGHSLADLTTRAEANPDISFNYLKDNDYNWVGSQAISDGIYDPATQVFKLQGKVTADVKKLVILGDSVEPTAKVNQVQINSDGTFTFYFHTAPTSQRPLAYIYTTADGSQVRGTVELILDTVMPTLDLTDANSYHLDQDNNYQIYTNQPTFTLAGTATDNLDGYRFFFNGDNDYREFHNSGVNYLAEAHLDGSKVTNPYPAYSFSKTFNLSDGANETTHVYTLSIVDLTGNTVTRKFYVHYQPETTGVNTVTTSVKRANELLATYDNVKVQVQANGSWADVAGELTAGKSYRFVNQYGNAVLVVNTLTEQNLVATVTTPGKEVTMTKTIPVSNSKGAKFVDVKSVSKTAPAVADELPQTGAKHDNYSLLGLITVAFASLLSIVGFKKKAR